jgi:hypothetical protein
MQRSARLASKKQTKNAHKQPDMQDALGGSRTFTITQAPNGPFGVAALREEIRMHSLQIRVHSS